MRHCHYIIRIFIMLTTFSFKKMTENILDIFLADKYDFFYYLYNSMEIQPLNVLCMLIYLA